MHNVDSDKLSQTNSANRGHSEGLRHSVPSPACGQGNRIWVNKYESLTERTESKSSEIPVLFTHMRLPCPRAGEGGEGARGRIEETSMVPLSSIQRTAEELMAKAAIEIPEDYLVFLNDSAATEKGDLSAFVIKAMLENYEAAKEDRRAMCGDTGVPRWYVKIGNDARIEGGPVGLEAALRRATARATHDVPLRPNRVHPLWRTDHNNNVGIGAPEIEYSFHPDADWIELTTVHKGGLFGSDYRMLFPGDGIEGIKRFYLDTLIGFGKRGLACQPAIVGVGLGGSKDISMVLGKQAACLRVVGSINPDPKIAVLEEEFKDI